MLVCPSCQQELDRDARFCGHCGEPLPDTTTVVAPRSNDDREKPSPDQPAQGLRKIDSAEATLVRKQPEGYSQQARQVQNPREAHQAADLVPAKTVTLAKPPDTPDKLSTISAQSLEAASESAAFNARRIKAETFADSATAITFVKPAKTTGELSSPTTPTNHNTGAPSRPSKATGEHAAFNIPVRPTKTLGHPVAFTLPVKSAESTDQFAALANFAESTETPGEHVVLAGPLTHENEPVDFIDFATLIKSAEVPADSSGSQENLIEPGMLDTFVMPTEISASQDASAAPAQPAETPPAGSARPVEIPGEPVAVAPFLGPIQTPVDPADPYAHIKRELSARRIETIAAMNTLLPFVYEDHRVGNQELFTSILAHRPPLGDDAWGNAAFVLGAYGNYMYRYPLNFEKKLEIWWAQLWTVYYERCHRRKYMAQRCQQLLHFFQGCAADVSFRTIALRDLETLYLYLEAGSLKKLQETLQALDVPPTDLLRHIDTQMVIAEREKEERIASQPSKNAASATEQRPPKQQSTPAQKGANRPANSPGRQATQQSSPTKLPAPGQQSVARQHTSAAEPALVNIPPQTRKLLTFFSNEQCQEFFASLRTTRVEQGLETINQLLRQVYKPLLTALQEALLAVGTLDYQKPRRSVPVRLNRRNGQTRDRFGEAFNLLLKSSPKERQMALEMFEQNVREKNIEADELPLAREWMLYARAMTQGITRVAGEWERDLQNDEASWEEIWNLAWFNHQTGYQAETLRILKPGLDALDESHEPAPVLHLRLGLICALALVLEPEKAEASALKDAQAFLLAYLERWPRPLSSLAWLALALETQGSVRPLDQSKRLSTFQELIEYPLVLPDPYKDLQESQLAALEDALVWKAHCDEAWFLWINDHAERHPSNYQVWQRLATTSERMRRLERAEKALQHMANTRYISDYATYKEEEGMPLPNSDELRRYVEKLFEFYQRNNLYQKALTAFEDCYSLLNHLWDVQEPANRRLITLTTPYLEAYQRAELYRHATEPNVTGRPEVMRRELSSKPTMPLEHFRSGQRVGIFVDYENIARFIPRGMDSESVGKALISYAAQFGEVVCQWVSASPRNLSNLANVEAGLKAAHFKIRHPRRELQFSAARKDLADFALLECMTNASMNERPEVYLLVSGDRDYYERICSLLDDGHVVRILASANENLSTRYRELEQQRLHARKAAGHEELDFFIDDLEEILPAHMP